MRRFLLLLLAIALTVGAAGASTEPRFKTIELATGVRLHYAEDGPDTSEPIIMLHGLSDSWFSFSGVLPLLADNQRVYALDLRGHGESGRPATGYHPRDMAADVIAFMDAKQIKRATIIGHSMGSFVAQYVATAAPQRVARLVLIGSASSSSRITDMDAFAGEIDKLTEPVPEPFARDFQVSTVHKPISDAFMDRAVKESLKLPVRVWRELAKGMMAGEPQVKLGELNIPTLLMRGEKDIWAVASEQTKLRGMIKSAREVTYRETGHALHWERPREFAADVKRFIAESR